MPIGCSGTKSTEPPSPGHRWCCLLSPLPFTLLGGGIIDPSELGPHKYGGGDARGVLYTCNGGFIDIAHIRDMADATWFYYQFVKRLSGTTSGDPQKTKIPVKGPDSYKGSITITTKVPEAKWIDVARSMAYDVSVFHEIETFYNLGPTAQHSSSFSPEDLVSNFLGTYVAGLALAAGGDFSTAVTTALRNLMTLLGARPKADTQTVFGIVKARKWMISIDSDIDKYDTEYLQRRNFNVSPIAPWLVPGAPGCPSPAYPSTLPDAFPVGTSGFYTMSLTPPSHASTQLGGPLTPAQFDGAIRVIKAELRAKDPDFETP